MDIKKYLEYARTPEAKALLFVKKYLNAADSTVWVDVIDYYAPAGYDVDGLMFKSVKCELFPRKTRPLYPDRRRFETEHDYIMACRAVTWETARHDIQMLRRRNYVGRRYRIRGVSYPVHKNAKGLVAPDPDKFFVESAPPEIKALARNLNDRTDPLWDKAVRYISPLYGGPIEPDSGLEFRFDDGYEFKITGINRLN